MDVARRLGLGGAVRSGSGSDVGLPRWLCMISTTIFGPRAKGSRDFSRSSGAHVLIRCWIRVELKLPILDFAWMNQIFSTFFPPRLQTRTLLVLFSYSERSLWSCWLGWLGSV
jgi:hypothetical protein